MAVEIKEIVVKAIIAGSPEKETEPTDKKQDLQEEHKTEQASVSANEALIQSCVDQVLKILRKRNLR